MYPWHTKNTQKHTKKHKNDFNHFNYLFNLKKIDYYLINFSVSQPYYGNCITFSLSIFSNQFGLKMTILGRFYQKNLKNNVMLFWTFGTSKLERSATKFF